MRHEPDVRHCVTVTLPDAPHGVGPVAAAHPNDRRVLMVHYYFPPLGGIGSIRAASMARHLPAFGWRPTVLAPRRGFYHLDPSLDDASLDVVRTASLELSRAARRGLGGRGGDDLAPLRPAGPLAALQRLARRWIYRPDAQVGWYPFAVHAGRGLLRERRFEAVFSSSGPVTTHLIARRLALDHGLPWVAEFRDPWTHLVPYDSRLRRALDLRLESRLLEDAAAVVTVSEGFAALLRQRGAREVAVVPNGFDPQDYPEGGAPEDVIAYLGTFYPGQQDLETVLDAAGRLIAGGELPATRLRFVGEYGPELAAAAARAGLAGRWEATGFVPHRAALGHLARARLLILAGVRDRSGDDPFVRGWIPAKAFEYVGARRPVLYVGNVHSEVAQLLRREAAAELVDPGDVPATMTALRRLLAQGASPPARDLSALTRQHRARQLARVLDAAIGR
jgi:hypothetical protein